MIVLSIASAIYLVALQNAAANNSRDQLMSCLDEAVTKGKTASIAADAFVGFARGQCGAARHLAEIGAGCFLREEQDFAQAGGS